MKILLTLSLLMLLPQTAAAEPMLIEFSEMISQCQSIAIVEFLGWDGPAQNAYEAFQYNLRVEQVLFGQAKAETNIKVGRAHGGVSLEKGRRCIAFINKDGAFEWVGSPMHTHQTIETGLLHLEGFYDYNAYLVAPGIITLAQLKDYIQNKEYKGKGRGSLHFFSNTTKKMEPSPIQFEVNYHYKNNQSTGSTKTIHYEWKRFKEKAALSLPAWDAVLSITIEPNMVHPLYIKGEVQSVAADGTLEILYWLEAPEELTYEEFLEYESNEKHGPAFYEMEVIGEKQTYKLVLCERNGSGLYISTFRGQRLDYSSYSDDGTREIIFPYAGKELVIKMEDRTVSKEALKYTRERLIRELKIHPIKGRIFLRDKNGAIEEVEKCELRYICTKFCPNINYRGK